MLGVVRKKVRRVKILGIDASTKCSGCAVVDAKGKLLFHSAFDLKHIDDIDERIDCQIENFIKLFDEWEPDICYIEDTWKAGKVLNIQTTKKLTNLIGAVRCLCIHHGCLFNTVYPSSWRSAIGIDGGKGTQREEFKQRAITWVKKKFDLDVSDDEDEGICIACAGNIMNHKIWEEEELF